MVADPLGGLTAIARRDVGRQNHLGEGAEETSAPSPSGSPLRLWWFPWTGAVPMPHRSKRSSDAPEPVGTVGRPPSSSGSTPNFTTTKSRNRLRHGECLSRRVPATVYLI